MPTYEYACRACGRHLEVQQSFSDAALTECPTCGGALRKVFSAPGISFKGSGFYKNDSRSSSSSSSSSGPSPSTGEPKPAAASTSSDGGATTTTTTAPAATPSSPAKTTTTTSGTD